MKSQAGPRGGMQSGIYIGYRMFGQHGENVGSGGLYLVIG